MGSGEKLEDHPDCGAEWGREGRVTEKYKKNQESM